MGRQIEELARFVARDALRGYSGAGAGARQAGAARYARRDPRRRRAAGGRGAARAARGYAGSGATVYARGWPDKDPRTAALLNGIAGRAIELCEGLRLVSGQAAMQVLPAVLAVGEQAASTGREMLAAFMLGYDVVGRLAGGFTPRPLAHQNGQVSLLAAAAAGARLRGLDAAGVSRAMRIATTLLLTPSYTNAVAGATTLNVAGGMSGFAGALAPESGDGRVRGAGGRDRGSARATGRRRFQRRKACSASWVALADHPQLLPPICLLQPDPPGARLPRSGARRAAARVAGADRAHRRRDLPFCLGHAQPGPAELFRLQILAAACRRGDGGARRRRVSPTSMTAPWPTRSSRRCVSGCSQRRPGDERPDAATAAGPGNRHLDRRPAGDPFPRQPPRRFQQPFGEARFAPSSANSPAPC